MALSIPYGPEAGKNAFKARFGSPRTARRRPEDGSLGHRRRTCCKRAASPRRIVRRAKKGRSGSRVGSPQESLRCRFRGDRLPPVYFFFFAVFLFLAAFLRFAFFLFTLRFTFFFAAFFLLFAIRRPPFSKDPFSLHLLLRHFDARPRAQRCQQQSFVLRDAAASSRSLARLLLGVIGLRARRS